MKFSLLTLIPFLLCSSTVATGTDECPAVGFEIDDFSAWTKNPSDATADAYTTFAGKVPVGVESGALGFGDWFGVVESEAAGDWQKITTTVSLTAGDTLFGAAAFHSTEEDFGGCEDFGFKDRGRVRVFKMGGGAPVLVYSWQFGSPSVPCPAGPTLMPWMLFGYSVVSDGNYKIEAAVKNVQDDGFDAYTFIDVKCGDDEPNLPCFTGEGDCLVPGYTSVINIICPGDTCTDNEITEASAEHGTVQISDDGKALYYTADDEFCGMDEVTYTLFDGVNSWEIIFGLWVGCIEESGYEVTCDGEEGPIVLTDQPDVDYTVGNIDVNFDDDQLAGAYPTVNLTFSSNLNTITSEATSCAAVLYETDADGKCSGSGDLIAHTPNAILNSAWSSMANPAIFDLNIDDSDPNNPVLEITALPTDFTSEDFYTQSSLCIIQSSEYCGFLNFCIEKQGIICDKKADFVDVEVTVELELEEDCDTDFCGEVSMYRASVVNEDTGFDNIGSIQCIPCDTDTGVDLTVLAVAQSEPVGVCIDVTTLAEDICVLEILDMNLIVYQNPSLWLSYNIWPGALFLADLPDYNPAYDPDSATLGFFPPVEEFQELYPCDAVEEGECECPGGEICTKQAFLKGTVRLGLGCYCTGTCDDDPDRRARNLQEGSVMVMAVESPAIPTTRVSTAIPTDDIPECKDNFFLGILQLILGLFLALFQFDPLCTY